MVYSLITILIFTLSFQLQSSINKSYIKTYYLVFLGLFLFSAFRYEVGCDWSSYENMFEAASSKTNDAKLVAKWLVGDISALLNKDNIDIDESNLSAENFGILIERISDGTISGKIAKSVLEEVWETSSDVDEIIQSKGLVQIQDESILEDIAKKVIESNPDQVSAYKAGKDKLFGFFVGQIMKETQGKANPKAVNEILKDLLN